MSESFILPRLQGPDRNLRNEPRRDQERNPGAWTRLPGREGARGLGERTPTPTRVPAAGLGDAVADLPGEKKSPEERQEKENLCSPPPTCKAAPATWLLRTREDVAKPGFSAPGTRP